MRGFRVPIAAAVVGADIQVLDHRRSTREAPVALGTIETPL